MHGDLRSKLAALGIRPHPFVWVVWLTAVAMVATLAYTAWYILPYSGEAKDFGWTEAQREGEWYVAAVSRPSAVPLAPGDRLVSLNDDPSVARSGTSFYRRDLQVGESYRLRIERSGTEYERLLLVGAVRIPRTNRLIWFFESIVWCAVALFVGFARPERPMVRLTFAGAAVTSLFFLAARVFPAEIRWVSVRPLHVVLGFHFFYRFPGSVPSGRIWN
ncbi:MAG: hypothetical protein HY646_15825, partial [Acidobacteria bacterium]|nr:hypothetical protein [Acidobacteriota bacterium]